MRFAVYLPLVLSLLVAPPLATTALCRLPDRIDPRMALRLLTASMLTLALTSTTALGLLVVGGFVWWSRGAVETPAGHASPGGWPAGALAALLLVIALGRATHVMVVRLRRRRQVRRSVPAQPHVLAADAAGRHPVAPARIGTHEAIVIDDDAIYAVAVPAMKGCRGRIVTSRGLLTLLDDDERTVVLAHEQEHLDGHHHRHLTLAVVAEALNPLLSRLCREVTYTVERCADEAAARQIDDRKKAAHAIGRTALAASRRPATTSVLDGSLGVDPAIVLGATTGPTPRRVAALLDHVQASPTAVTARLPRPSSALLTRDLAMPLAAGIVLAGLVLFTTAGLLHAAWDLSDVLGLRHPA